MNLKVMEPCGECSVCFFTMDWDNMSLLPCGHTFHYDCLYKCIDLSGFCPKCRRPSTVSDIIRKVFIERKEIPPVDNDGTSVEVHPLVLELKERLISTTIAFNKLQTSHQAAQEDLMFTRDQIRYMDGLYKGMKRQRDELMLSYRNLMGRFYEVESRFLYEKFSTQPGTSSESVLRATPKEQYSNLSSTGNNCISSVPAVYAPEQTVFRGIENLSSKNGFYPVQQNMQQKPQQQAYQQPYFSDSLGQLTNSQLMVGNPYMATMASNSAANPFPSSSSSFSYNFCSNQQTPFFQGDQGLSANNNLVYNVGMMGDNNNNYEVFF